MTRFALSVIATTSVLVAAPAVAQDSAPRTTVSFIGGASSTTSTTGVALGGNVLVDLNDWAGIEAQGTYLDRGAGATAFDVTGSLLVNVVPSGRPVVPYLAGGGGIYRASFDLGAPRFLGPVVGQFAPGTVVCPAAGTGVGPGPGAGFGPGTGSCDGPAGGYWGVGQMNTFYAQRLGQLVVPAGEWQTRSFVDPAVSLGGGVRFNVTEHLMVRPDARALVVFANGDIHTVGLFGINVGYRF